MWWPMPVLSWWSIAALVLIPLYLLLMVVAFVHGFVTRAMQVRLVDKVRELWRLRRAPVATPVSLAHRRGALKEWVR